MRLPMRPDGIATRIVVAALVVVAVALAILAIGVLRIAADSFAALMVEAGDSAEHAGEMFQASVAAVFVLATVVAVVGAIILGSILARRIARPIERLAEAAQRTAEGDLRATAPLEGPAEVRALADSFNVMVDRLAEQDAIRRDFVINASHELRTPLTNLQGYLEALRDGVLPPDPATFDSLREEVDRLGRLAASLDLLAGAEDDRPVPEDLDLGMLV
ncbi:MAG: HAMP domain-containing protein, partial [Chloroflexi bacterium]|nr:HAMP domain-containing protein [Chloroflexota bacterium]